MLNFGQNRISEEPVRGTLRNCRRDEAVRPPVAGGSQGLKLNRLSGQQPPQPFDGERGGTFEMVVDIDKDVYVSLF